MIVSRRVRVELDPSLLTGGIARFHSGDGAIARAAAVSAASFVDLVGVVFAAIVFLLSLIAVSSPVTFLELPKYGAARRGPTLSLPILGRYGA